MPSAYSHMDVEAAIAVKWLDRNYVLPMHYGQGLEGSEQFHKEVQKVSLRTRVVSMKASEELSIEGGKRLKCLAK